MAASAPDRTIAELGTYRGLSEQSGKSAEPGSGIYMVLEPMQAIYVGTLTGIGPGIEQPPSRLSAKSQAKALPRMRCSPSGSFWLLFARWKLVGSSPGRSTENSRRAPCSWDIGGNCVSGAGNLIDEIAHGNYHDCSTLYLAWTGRRENPACAVFHRFCPWAMSWPCRGHGPGHGPSIENTARLAAGTGPKACRLPKASHRDSFAAL